MPQHTRSPRRATALALVLPLLAGSAAASHAQPDAANANPGGVAPLSSGTPPGSEFTPLELRGKMLSVPVGTFIPGGVSFVPNIKIPGTGDPAAAQRGMKAFNAFNCVGCHMGNGGGGMGPALSNRAFIYGSKPADIYLTIVQGRPKGMPAWGTVLPDAVVWDLVAYVTNLSKAPGSEWGQTFSAKALSIEQVPAEQVQTDNPWQYTKPFTSGQKP